MTASPVRLLRGLAVVLPLLLSPMTAVIGSAQQESASFDPVTMDPMLRDSIYPPGMEELDLTSGGERMNALMYVAQGQGPYPTVVLLHGYPGYESNLDLAQVIRRAGMNVLFFHYRWSVGKRRRLFVHQRAGRRCRSRAVRALSRSRG